MEKAVTIQKNQGFTLIEVIISLMIMSLVISLAVGSYRYFLNFGAQDHVQALNNKVEQLARIQLINDNLRNVQPFYYSNRLDEKALYFIGEEKYLSFVTATPILEDSAMAIAFLYLEIEKEYDVLKYCEIPLGKLALKDMEDAVEQCTNTIEYMRAFDIELDYFAYPSVDAVFGNLAGEAAGFQVAKVDPQWYREFNSGVSGLLPSYMRIKSVLADDKYTFIPSEFLIRFNQENPDSLREQKSVEG